MQIFSKKCYEKSQKKVLQRLKIMAGGGIFCFCEILEKIWGNLRLREKFKKFIGKFVGECVYKCKISKG